MKLDRLWASGARSLRTLRGFSPLIGFNAVFYISFATFGAYISAYYRSCGMSVGEIGILTAIGPFVALFMQPFWGILGDKLGNHMRVLRIALVGTILTVLLYYIAKGFWPLALVTGIYSVFNVALQPMGDAVTIRQTVVRGFRFSVVRLGGTLGYSLVIVFVGDWLSKTPSLSFGLTSGVLAVLLGLSFAISATSPKEPPVPTPAPRTGKHGKLDFGTLFKNKKILFIFFYAFVFQICLGYYGAFFGPFILDLGYDSGMIGRMMCISALSEVPVLMFIDRFMRRFRAETLLLFGGLVMVTRMLLMQLGGMPGLVVCQMLQGLTGMVLYYSTITILNENLTEELRGTGQAALCMVQTGLACLFSNIIGGQLAEWLGLNAVYFIFAGLLLVVTLGCMLYFWLRGRRERLLTCVKEEPA